MEGVLKTYIPMLTICLFRYVFKSPSSPLHGKDLNGRPCGYWPLVHYYGRLLFYGTCKKAIMRRQEAEKRVILFGLKIAMVRLS